ncbi:hypothetical protein D3C81_313200 [compost metagenome]
MKQTAEVALAKDQLSRIQKHLVVGYRLRRRGLGLEHHAEIVRFNAVADNILGGFPTVVAQEDYQQGEDLNRRVVSMEGLLGAIKNFLLGKTKEAVSKKEDVPFWQRLNWLDSEVEGLVTAYEDREGTVTIAKRYAGFFKGQGALAAQIKADTVQYKGVFSKAKPELDKQAKFMHDIDNQFKAFMGDVDRPDEFAALIKAINAKQTDGLASKWTEVPHAFMGWGKLPYLNKSASTGKGEFFYNAGNVDSDSEVTLPYPTKAELVAVVKELRLLCEAFAAIEIYNDDYPYGFDFTDPPIRGYYDFPQVDDELSNANWGMESFEANNSYFVQQLVERMSSLGEALIVYLEGVLK